MSLPVSFKYAELLKNNQASLAGQWCGAQSEKSFAVRNPADNEIISRAPDMGAAEVEIAIQAAYKAQKLWSTKTAAQRASLMQKWYELIMRHQDDLAKLITLENGKPLREAQGEVTYAASYIEWFAQEAPRVYGEIIPPTQNDRRLLVIKQPVGVCAAITPWNFPAAMITRKVGAALAGGCVMIVKPAEQTPLTAFALAQLAYDAGIEPEVLQVITGDAAEIGQAFCKDRRVAKLSFTGSTEVGRLLMQQSADTLKKLSLELGGHAPFIVFADADIDAAVEGAIQSKYRNAGQTCVCANRFLIHSSVMSEFAEKLTHRVSQLVVGNGLDARVSVGPLINQEAMNKVSAHVDDAFERGARILTGGSPHELGGNFFAPTVLADVSTKARIWREETFGPVAPLFSFDDEEEAIALANQSEYGLAGYFYTRDLKTAWRAAENLEYGMVGVNTGILSAANAPFGGIKQSGYGREGSHHGMDEYLQLKYVCMAGL